LKLPGNNRAVLARIVSYIANKTEEVSMGEIEEELGISLQKQYVLFRGYKTFFPGLKLSRGNWTYTYQEATPIPESSQEVLSGKGP
jgi:hypothetical protein